MRLLIYTAAIAVLLLTLGWRLASVEADVRENHAYTVEHVAELGARIEVLEQLNDDHAFVIRNHTRRIREMNCVHFIYEDGSAMHPDAEVAHRCLQTQLGWP